MNNSTPWKTGAKLALLLAISYIACATAYAAWPVQNIDVLNVLLRGHEARRNTADAPLVLTLSFYPLLFLAVWGFAVGTLFAWRHRMLYQDDQ